MQCALLFSCYCHGSCSFSLEMNNLIGDKVVKQSFLSKLFRNLIKINLIPVKWDRDTNKLTFKYLSKALGIYYFYGITLLLCSCLGVYLFGFYNWIEFLKKLYFNSNVTDLITYVAFMAFVCSQLQIYPLFCKNLIIFGK